MFSKMNAFTHFLLFTILFLFPGYNNSDTEIYLREMEPIPLINENVIMSLTEFIQPFSGNYILVHSKPEAIHVINDEGELKSQLGRSGKGPFEWQRPRYTQVLENEIIFWDAGNLKVFGFNENFQPEQELKGIRHAIRGLRFKNRNIVAVLHDIPGENEYIKLYEKSENGSLVLKDRFGKLTEEGRKLHMIFMSGGILWNSNDLIWCDPAIPEINIFNTEEKQFKKIEIPDDRFSVEDWGNKVQSPNNIEDFIFSNSRVVSLQKLEDYIMVEIEHFQDGESLIMYHFFDFNYNHVGDVNAGEGGFANYIRGVDKGNRLIFWGEDYNETGELNSLAVRKVMVR